MATTDCVTASGVRSAAAPFKAGSTHCVTRLGIASAASPVAWAGTTAARSQVPWLPPMHVDPVRYVAPARAGDKPRLQWNPDVYRFLQYLAEQVAGGINGKTLPETLRELVRTQAEVVATTNYTAQVGQYAQSVAVQAAATVQVAKDNGLAGADAIPPASDPPERRYGSGEVIP